MEIPCPSHLALRQVEADVLRANTAEAVRPPVTKRSETEVSLMKWVCAYCITSCRFVCLIRFLMLVKGKVEYTAPRALVVKDATSTWRARADCGKGETSIRKAIHQPLNNIHPNPPNKTVTNREIRTIRWLGPDYRSCGRCCSSRRHRPCARSEQRRGCEPCTRPGLANSKR